MPPDEQHSLQFMQSFDEEFPLDDITPDDLKSAALLLHLRGPNLLSGWLMRLSARMEAWNDLKKRLESDMPLRLSCLPSERFVTMRCQMCGFSEEVPIPLDRGFDWRPRDWHLDCLGRHHQMNYIERLADWIRWHLH